MLREDIRRANQQPPQYPPPPDPQPQQLIGRIPPLLASSPMIEPKPSPRTKPDATTIRRMSSSGEPPLVGSRRSRRRVAKREMRPPMRRAMLNDGVLMNPMAKAILNIGRQPRLE